ncbi:MAG: photosynthetic reaction center subunit H [Oceanicaulis sp.]
MSGGIINGSFDLTTLLFMAFVLFFIGLVFYLRREDRREGYPLETDNPAKLETPGAVWYPTQKEFRQADGSVSFKPDGKRDPAADKMKRLAVWPGSPSEPVGDPMTSGVGPGAYVLREDKPDVTHEGLPKIVPMRLLPDFDIAKGDPDPRGMAVIGADGETAGVISDVWVDRAEALIRYHEVELAEGGRKVLLPYAFVNIHGKARQAKVKAILAGQFAGVPAHASPDQVTRLEEDKISAYYAGGLLYATSDRQEPWI